MRIGDPIPPTHYGPESLANATGCYGVAVTVDIGIARAGRRTRVACPFAG